MKTITIRLSDELHRVFKIVCAANGTDMQAQTIECIESYVEHNREKLAGIQTTVFGATPKGSKKPKS